MLLATLLLIRWQPGPMLWLLPTDDLAKRAVAKRVMPLLECNPIYESYLPPPKVSKADALPLRGMPLYYTGVRTPSKLASIPARYLVMDESAKYEKVKANEADPIQLAMERVKSFASPLVIQASTPNVPENQFWQTFEQSAKSYWIMPCPHCQKEFRFEWTTHMVQWPEGHPEEAYIVCPFCKKQINDQQRMEMIRNGHWIHSNEDAYKRGELGYHLNSLYSRYVTIGEMALKWHQACHSLNKSDAIRNFTNSWLAEPYQEHITKVYADDITTLINPMVHKGVVPADFKLLVLGVDVGQNESHWVVSAVLQDGKIQVVDWGTLMSISSELGGFGLACLFDELKYQDEAGNTYYPDVCLVDSGYATQKVYDECLRATIPGSIIPVKGSTSTRGAWSKTPIRTMPQAAFELLLFSDFQLKKGLYLDAVKQKRIILPDETDDALIHGLSGQELQKSKTGKVSWKEVADDHFGDALKYAILANWVYSVEQWCNQ